MNKGLPSASFLEFWSSLCVTDGAASTGGGGGVNWICMSPCISEYRCPYPSISLCFLYRRLTYSRRSYRLTDTPQRNMMAMEAIKSKTLEITTMPQGIIQIFHDQCMPSILPTIPTNSRCVLCHHQYMQSMIREKYRTIMYESIITGIKFIIFIFS